MVTKEQLKTAIEKLGIEKVKLLNVKNIYFGTQIEFADIGVCCGVVADI